MRKHEKNTELDNYDVRKNFNSPFQYRNILRPASEFTLGFTACAECLHIFWEAMVIFGCPRPNKDVFQNLKVASMRSRLRHGF